MLTSKGRNEKIVSALVSCKLKFMLIARLPMNTQHIYYVNMLLSIIPTERVFVDVLVYFIVVIAITDNVIKK